MLRSLKAMGIVAHKFFCLCSRAVSNNRTISIVLKALQNFLFRLADVIGFRGCISSLRIGDEHLDVFVDAEETVGVTKGCAGGL